MQFLWNNFSFRKIPSNVEESFKEKANGQTIKYPEASTHAFFPGDISPSTIQNTWDQSFELSSCSEFLTNINKNFTPEFSPLSLKADEKLITQSSSNPTASYFNPYQEPSESKCTTTVETLSETSSFMAPNDQEHIFTNTATVTESKNYVSSYQNFICYILFRPFALAGLAISTFFKNDALVFFITTITLGYLINLYFTLSLLHLILFITLITICSYKLAERWLRTKFPNGFISRSAIVHLESNSIIDLAQSYGHIKPFIFYASRLTLLIFMNPSEKEKELIFKDWDPKLRYFFTSHIFNLLPNFFKNFLYSKIDNSSPCNIVDNSFDNCSPTSHLLLEESNVQQYTLEPTTSLPLLPSSPKEDEFDQDIMDDKSQHDLTDEKYSNKAHLNEFLSLTQNYSTLKATPVAQGHANFFPLVTRILLSRFLFNRRVDSALLKLKLGLHNMFSILALISLALYTPSIKQLIKRLPLGFIFWSFFSLYFYALCHGWPIFLRKIAIHFKKIIQKLKFTKILAFSSRIEPKYSERTKGFASVEDACIDLLREFSLVHTRPPKLY